MLLSLPVGGVGHSEWLLGNLCWNSIERSLLGTRRFRFAAFNRLFSPGYFGVFKTLPCYRTACVWRRILWATRLGSRLEVRLEICLEPHGSADDVNKSWCNL